MRARAFDRELLPFAAGARRWRVLVGVDLETSPGTYAVSIEAERIAVGRHRNLRARCRPAQLPDPHSYCR